MNLLADYAAEWEFVLGGEVTASSRKIYLRAVRQFDEELDPEITELDQITQRHVREWLASLASAGRSNATRRVRLIGLRLFFGYLVGEPDIELSTNPAAGLKLPQVTVQPTLMPREADVSKVLATMSGPSFRDRRDVLAIRLLADCGCRRAELVGIDMEDVKLDIGRVLLRRTKGGVERWVPLSPSTVQACRKYLRARKRHPAATQSTALLLSQRRIGDCRLTGSGVFEMLNRRCDAAGIERIRPHSLRHLWAHDQLASGVGETSVETLAGWRSPTMIRRYGASLAAERAIDASQRKARGDRF
jgi:site-specific recombinase XerD